MMVLQSLVFIGAFGASVSAIAMTVAPQWRRMVSLATGHVEPAFSPLAQLAVAERRIAVRRWSAASSPLAVRRMRAAA